MGGFFVSRRSWQSLAGTKWGTKPAQSCPPTVNCGGVAEKAVSSTRFTASS